MTPLRFRSARADERIAALQLAFQHLDEPEQRHKIHSAQDMIGRGDLDPDGIWVAEDGTGLAGCILAIALPGAAAIIWPPQCRRSLANASVIEDGLIQRIIQWTVTRGARVAQVMLLPEEADFGEPLLRSGFQQVTRLLYWRHFLDLAAEELAAPERLQYRTADTMAHSDFEQVVADTYVGTLDCPELNQARGAVEFLAGHRAASEYDPTRWWIASADQHPVGVLLMNQTESDTWDMAYLGVVPSARRQGIGRELVRKALFEAKAAGMLMVTLALDQRNEPARRLYHRAGFEPFDERIVLLRNLP